jgi:hypothetical protein
MATMVEQLEALIVQEEWFKEASGSVAHLGRYANGVWPQACEFQMTYRSRVCAITVDNEKDSQKLRIRPTNPYHKTHRTRSTVEKAADVMVDMFVQQIAVIEKEHEQMLQAEERKRQALEAQQAILTAFDTPKLEVEPYGFTFKPTRRYNMAFYHNPDTKYGKQAFCITSISGSFTMEEIKQFMNTLSTTPSVAADRILNDK